MAMNQEDPGNSLHLLMFPWLGFGHILPFVQLSNRLNDNGVKITFLSPPSLTTRIRTFLHTSIPIFNYHLPSVDGLPFGVESTNSDPAMIELLALSLDKTEPQIAVLMRQLSPNAIVFGFALNWVPKLAESLGIKSFFFSVYSAIAGESSVRVATMSRRRRQFIISMMQNIPPSLLAVMAGLKIFEARNAITYFKSRHGQTSPSLFHRMAGSIIGAYGIISKSAKEIEPNYVGLFANRCKKPVLLTGALMPKASQAELEPELDNWLKGFPASSVVFCSFGSETNLSRKQLRELVDGLEMSGSPFLAVFNFSNSETDPTDHEKEKDQIVGQKGRGMVRTGWVQQELVLRHPSVGGYICHGGHSSIMEGVAGGCQMVMVPQKADQFLNSKLIVEILKAGVAVRRRSQDGWFTKKNVCTAVKFVMTDDSEKAQKLRANNAKLREFLLDEKIQNDYIRDFIASMKLVSTL